MDKKSNPTAQELNPKKSTFMKKIVKGIVVVAIAFIMAFTAKAQDNVFNMHKALPNSELRQLVNRNPWMPAVYQASKGQDIDLTVITIVDDKLVNDVVVGSDTTVFWKIRPYTGWKLSVGIGGSADFSLGDNPDKNFGGALDIRFGYAMRRFGIDAFIGMSTIGTVKGRELGFYNFGVMPYGTIGRWGQDDQNRFDIGAIIGVQQASASVYDAYKTEDGMVWGDSGRKSTMPRAMVGGFLRYERRAFMGATRFAIEAGAVVYGAKAAYHQYAENVTTGEVLIDRNQSVNTPHVMATLKFVLGFDLGRSANNYK